MRIFKCSSAGRNASRAQEDFPNLQRTESWVDQSTPRRRNGNHSSNTSTQDTMRPDDDRSLSVNADGSECPYDDAPRLHDRSHYRTAMTTPQHGRGVTRTEHVNFHDRALDLQTMPADLRQQMAHLQGRSPERNNCPPGFPLQPDQNYL